MSLAPLTSVPVTRIDSIIEIVSKGDGSHEHDEVFVSTTMTLANDIDAATNVTLLLPMSTESGQKPLLRYIDDDIQATAITFDPVDRSEYDQKVADILASMADGANKKEERALASAIKKAAASVSQAVLTVKPGQRQLRFFFTVAAKKVSDREFEAQILGPLASFAIGTGGSISVLAVLARNTTLVEAKALQDPNNPGVDHAWHRLQGAMHFKAREVWVKPDLYPTKYRFVVGHEIGHAILPWHEQAFACLDDKSRLDPDFADLLERQASQVSIELLAQGDGLRSEADDSPLSMSEISGLAGRYDISIQAAARHIVETSRQCVALSVHYRGRTASWLSPAHIYWSSTFASRFGWEVTGPPELELDSRAGAALTNSELGPLLLREASGRVVAVSCDGLATPYAVFTLLRAPTRRFRGPN